LRQTPSLARAIAIAKVTLQTVDLAMGWCVGNLGWKHPDIEAAMRAFDGPTYVHPEHHHRPAQQLAERLLSVAPGKLRKVFRATGGTEAIELALQAAMLATRRHGLLCLEEAYHGNSIATLSIGSSQLTDARGRTCYALHRESAQGSRVERPLVLDVATSLPEGTELDVLVVDPGEQDQFVAAIRQGLEDSEAGRVVDDEALGRDLDAELGHLQPG
jgi:4-aminobutyrate aminotransferase-like enzyme